MRAACYSRVSSATQKERETIASQLRVLPEFVARMGWQLAAPADTYVDDGKSAQSGRLAKRTGLAAMLRDAAEGAFDVICVVDIDRLTRSEDIAERGAILGALQAAGVKIATPSSGIIDLQSDEGDLIGNLSSYFAAAWGRKHKARIKAGKETAIARGRKPAGPTPFGYVYDRTTGAWSPHPVNAAIVRRIYERVAAGETSVVIADDLDAAGVARPRSGRWSRERVWALATSRTYLGEWTADKARRRTVAVPQLVDDALWHAAQDALKRHGKRGLRRTKHVYLLEGLAVCGVCGARICIRSATKQRRGRVSEAAYVCGNRKRAHRGQVRCDAPAAWVSLIDEAVWATVSAELADPALPEAIFTRIRAAHADATDWQGRIDEARRQLARADKTEAAVLARFRRELIGEAALDAELVALKRDRLAARKALAEAERGAARSPSPAAAIAAVRDALARLRSDLGATSPADRQALVARLIQPGDAVLVDGAVRLRILVAHAV